MFFIFSLVKHILTVRAVQRLKIQINKTIVHFFSRASILIFKGFSIEYYTIFGTLRHSQVAKKKQFMNFPMKKCDFPVRYVNVYLRVIFIVVYSG